MRTAVITILRSIIGWRDVNFVGVSEWTCIMGGETFRKEVWVTHKWLLVCLTHKHITLCVNRDSKIIIRFRMFCCERKKKKKKRLVNMMHYREDQSPHKFSPQFCKKKKMQLIFFIFQSSQLVGPKMDQKFALIWSLTSEETTTLQTIKMHLIFNKGENASHCFWVWCQRTKLSKAGKYNPGDIKYRFSEFLMCFVNCWLPRAWNYCCCRDI